MLKSNKLKGNLMLLLTALIWGSAFVAQRSGMEYTGPFTFNSVRCLIGGFVLLPVIAIMDLNRKRKGNQTQAAESDNKTLITGGLICGLVLFVASSLQQVALVYTTAGKAGFITSLYIVFVPIIGLFLRKKASVLVWVSVGIAAVGLYFLCVTESFSLNKWDMMVLFCAVSYAVHILVIDRFSSRVDGVKMACIQYFVSGIISLPLMFLLEKPVIDELLSAWIQLVYAGVLSCGVAYTLQIVAQKYTEPAIASLLMSSEAVFALIAGMIILGETMSLREWLGCLLMFAAILLSQKPEQSLKNDCAL